MSSLRWPSVIVNQHTTKVNLVKEEDYTDPDIGQFSVIILLYRKSQSTSVWKGGLVQLLARQLVFPSMCRMQCARGEA